MPPNSGLSSSKGTSNPMPATPMTVNKSYIGQPVSPPPTTSFEATLYIKCDGITKSFKITDINLSQNFNNYNPGTIEFHGTGMELDTQFNEDMLASHQHTGKKGM